jgi:ABC-type glycerol-3-phosphate transport system substrate-binding protein
MFALALPGTMLLAAGTRRRRRLALWGALGLAACLAIGAMSCGGSSAKSTTQPQSTTSNVTVTATAGGATVGTMAVTLTVTQ